MIRFEKVSFEEFSRALVESCGIFLSTDERRAYYDAIKLPTRSTPGSAGYDIATPIPINILIHCLSIPCFLLGKCEG